MLEKETVNNMLRPLVMSGIYKDESAALKDIVLDYIDRKRKEYDTVISFFMKKYHTDFDTFTKGIENSATLEDEDDWMEWKGAIEMKTSWQEAYRMSINGKTEAF